MGSGKLNNGNFSMDVAMSMTICEGNLTSQKAVDSSDTIFDQFSNHLQINQRLP